MARPVKEYLYVDGYNVINSWDVFKDVADDLEYARDILINIMVEYKHYTKIDVIVVFDAHMIKGNSGTKEVIDGVEVVFTKENETADHYIEKSLEDNIFKKIRVATSDRMEQQIILGKGGIRMSAKELEAEVAAYKRLVNYKIKKDKVKQKRSMGKLSENNLKALEKFLK